jgi:hypothetical protein
MVRLIHKLILLFFLFFVFKTGVSESVDVFIPLIKQYQLAYNNSDFSLLNAVTFSSEEYAQIIKNIDKENPDCLTEFDKNFDVKIFQRSFEKSHLVTLKSDSIVIDEIADIKTCSNLDIKKLSCFFYFKKQNKSVPVTLIIVNSSNKTYKILLDIINENNFSNEKF